MEYKLPAKITELVGYFSRFPGIGERSALRHVLSLVNWKVDDIKNFSEAMSDILNLRRCTECGFYCDEQELCNICASDERSSETICVVESVADCLAIEKSGGYKGKYHILGGVLDPLAGIGPDNLTIGKLLMRINNRSVKEVIIALNPSVEGDITSSYLRDKISEDTKVKRLGIGLPMGGSLEYLDALTIDKAIENGKYF